jgi:uroporphyrinogen-III decarboxylase
MTNPGATAGDRLAGMDFAAHNAQVRDTWEAYNAGRPTRVPVMLGVSTRFFMKDPTANPAHIGFHPYSEDPDVMFEAQLRYQRWGRFNLLQDAELGLPERWSPNVDFQNHYEAAWFGCEVEYPEGEVPDTRPAYADCPERLVEKGLPDPYGGIMGLALEYYERFRERAVSGETYLDRPIEPAAPWCGLGTDGPLTAACSLFGPTFVCMAMASEPDRLHRLLDFITEATIRRMEAFRQRFGVPVPQDGFGMADDSIALISTRMYRDHILPYHKRLYDRFGTSVPGSIHLCGDSTRHFVTIRDELNVRSFDTGFPVDFGRLRRDLGPGVRINGGPHVEFLRSAQPAEVREEVRRILQSGVLEGGMFVLREGNNLAPLTPLANVEAMYRAGREFGTLATREGASWE